MEARSFPGLLDSDLRRFASTRLVTFAAHREGRIENNDMPCDQPIEKMPERRQVLLSSGNTETLQFIEILPDILRARFGGELNQVPFALCQELLHGVKISTSGRMCLLRTLPVEEFLSGKDVLPPDPHGS